MEAPWHVTFLTIWRIKFTIGVFANITDENMSRKEMRVRAKDVAYMTTSWENGIRAKRRALAHFHKDKSESNWEKLRRCRNESARQRRIAIKSF